MEPKLKAKELINKYINLTEECDCLEYMCICFSIPEYKAKHCALIAVNLVLSLFIYECEDTRYWQEVKQEIELL
jgi:hypothetical protein